MILMPGSAEVSPGAGQGVGCAPGHPHHSHDGARQPRGGRRQEAPLSQIRGYVGNLNTRNLSVNYESPLKN